LRGSSEIVKGLRSFSRLDDDKFQHADLHDGLDSSLILLYNKTKGRINVHKEYGDLPKVECLPSKINQVFMNLLTNSIQAIEGRGDIFIETISSGIGVKYLNHSIPRRKWAVVRDWDWPSVMGSLSNTKEI